VAAPMDEDELKAQIDQLLRDVTGQLQDPNKHFAGDERANLIRRLRESAADCRQRGWSVAERTLELRAEQLAAKV
jgi:hypothetical protein